MSEKEKEMREMVETLRKLPDHAQEKIGYMTVSYTHLTLPTT